MKRITGGTFTPSSGSIATPKTVVTLAAPPCGGASYRVEIRLTDLDLSATLVIDDTRGSIPYQTVPVAPEDENYILVYECNVYAGAGDAVIAVLDTSGNSSSGVAGMYDVYRVDNAELLQQPGYLVPKGETSVPLLFRFTGTFAGTPVVQLLKNGGAGYAVAAGTVSALADGWWKLTPTSADTGSEGPLLLRATAGTAPYTEVQHAAYQVYSDATEGLIDAIVAGLTDLINSLNVPPTPSVNAEQWTLRITETESPATPIDGVEVWVSRDAEGLDVIKSGHTDDQGYWREWIDPGDYYWNAELAGRVSKRGVAFTVEAV